MGTLTANQITIAFSQWLTGVKLYLFNQLLKSDRLGLEIHATHLDALQPIAFEGTALNSAS